MGNFIIGIAGNPNCGKTTLFNELTGTKQRVGNWPGVTVDRKVGHYSHDAQDVDVVDLPGIYSLSASSVDEKVARDYILSGEPDVIVNIVDASNIERNLYLTTQLLEMKVPMVVALNMMDIARSKSIDINIEGFSKILDCPVIPLVASKKEGLEELKRAINQASQKRTPSQTQIVYPVELEESINEIVPKVEEAFQSQVTKINSRWSAVKLLEGDTQVASLFEKSFNETINNHIQVLEDKLGEEPDIVIADSRYGFINWLGTAVVKKTTKIGKTLTDKIDRVVLNRYLGIPIFFLAMYAMFMFVINFGGAFIDFFDIFAGTVFVDGFGHLLNALGAPQWLVTILAGGLGGGIQTIATFIPPIGFMFLALSFLEDSGYMARAAFVMDRFMRFIGLPGKSFVPMLVGFGCNVPAIMATRTLETERDRTLTIMMNPFMSCGARLPVYALFAAAFFPVGGQNIVFLLYLLGIFFAVITGLILKSTILKGEITPFVMELPPYHSPTLKGIVLRAWDRLKTFILRAGHIIIPVVMILSFLNSFGTDGTSGNENTDKSVLSSIGKKITPLFAPMGLKEENWPATVGIFTGVFAKEAVVGTLDSLYSQLHENGSTQEESFSLYGGIKEAFTSVPANLIALTDTILDPLGVSMVGDVNTVDEAAQAQEVNTGTFGSMVILFAGKIGAFTYLLFILLYSPCVAAMSAVYRETNLKWTLFVSAWTTMLAYMAAVLFYQTATFANHPASSLLWIGAIAALFFIIVYTMKIFGHDEDKTGFAVEARA